MSQKAAASLTSSLFARKGKASPASLLISELEAAGAEAAEAGTPAAANARAGAANGRRRPKPVPDLPLLAYVEAQEAADEAANDTADERLVDAAPKPEVDLPPAASLLEHGTRSLRRVNGHGASKGAPEMPEAPAVEPAVEAGPAPDPQPPAPLDEDAAADGVLDAEIVSGDANVAAIEDAPQDDAAPAEPVAEEVPAEEVVAEEPAAAPAETPVASTAEGGAAGADQGEAEVAAASGEAAVSAAAEAPAAAAARRAVAPSLPATLALRKAASLHTPPPLAPEAAAALPPSRAAGLVWRSAAVVALGAALGLGFYLALSGEPAAPPVATAPAPATITSPDATSATASAAPPAVVAVPAEPAQAGPAVETAVTAPPEPSFDIIRIEPDGQSIIAGRALPGSEWILLNNGSPIAAVRADANGEWVVLPDAALLPGANAFSLVPKDERGKVAIPAPTRAGPDQASPAQAAPAEADVPAALPEEAAAEPRAEAAMPEPGVQAAGLSLPDLPRPKPPVQASVAPGPSAGFQAAAQGPYEVQLASVRAVADADRERLRLSQAYPALLGGMDLRVQEARLEGSGLFYRVRSGAIGQLEVARDLCRRLEAEGQGCLVVRRPEAPAEAAVESAESVSDATSAVRQQAERPQLAAPQ